MDGSDGAVLLHFGMTGSLRWTEPGEPGHRHDRVVFVLADEILWRARIHPRQSTTHLSDADCRRIHARMRAVLRQAIPTGRVPPRKSWLTGRRDEPSGSRPRCGSSLSRGRAGGRSTVWCPNCQPLKS